MEQIRTVRPGDEERLAYVQTESWKAAFREIVQHEPYPVESKARDILQKLKEGGITRFMPVFTDYKTVGEVGPVRSGRDQFLQLLMPWQALYYHDGESAPCTKFISVYNYSGLNIGGKSYFNTPTHPHVAHRDSRGRNVAYEHTEFTSGKELVKRDNGRNDGRGFVKRGEHGG